eukprot:TRINITY_DN31119_c0_g1_i1.p1 TRINITY_DN31119_c0_g1~~TRINITY_DN31119_c0_g1_i1.p1  ORF type:complete len:795 (+),score=125.07 TRINITY_DN31119_c0_g1_i1:125-2509(+)
MTRAAGPASARLLDMSSPLVREARLAYDFSLNNLLWKQAAFFAERLVAECPCDESTYLLGLACFYGQETSRASWHLQGNRLAEARYLLARCCFALQQWEEAEDALIGGCTLGTGGAPGNETVVNGAAGYHLLGQVRERQSRPDQAIECYARSLELCPFMWEAYERWSWLALAVPSSSRCTAAGMAITSFSEDKFAAQVAAANSAANSVGCGGFGIGSNASVSGWSPSPGNIPSQARQNPQNQAGGPSRSTPPNERVANGFWGASGGGGGGAGGGYGFGFSPRLSQNAPPRNSDLIHKEVSHHAPRKQRLSTGSCAGGGHHGGGGQAGAGGGFGAPAGTTPGSGGGSGASLPRRLAWPTPVGQDCGGVGGTNASANVTSTAGGGHGHGDGGTSGGDGSGSTFSSLLCKLGVALHAVHCFENSQAIQLLSSLPRRHYETGYVLDLVGLCYFESADYRTAEQVYQQAWRLDPRRVEGLEHYSSTLWHLRKEVDLGHLAQQCLQWDRLKPQVWCVVGNCFSLQKEHDVAIKFFKRAIQVDPSFTYAYTLCGHEFAANDKFDKATPMYEHALRIDSWHYNAWWGLGNICHRQEEHETARHHFLKALEINKNNSVLRCYLGMAYESLNSPVLALENFDRASRGEPQNGMAYFCKACVLISLERYEEALVDLKMVRCLAPKEACVHFQLGKVYMKLRKDRQALIHFNLAMDLSRDSKDYHTVKTHIEQLNLREADSADDSANDPVRSSLFGPPGGSASTSSGGGGSRRNSQVQHSHAAPRASSPVGTFPSLLAARGQVAQD